MEAVEGTPGGVSDAPRLAAVKEDAGDHGLVERDRHPGLDPIIVKVSQKLNFYLVVSD